LNDPPEGFRVEPVYAVPNQSGYRYARQFTLRFLNCPDQTLLDDAVDVFNGDIFLGLDLQLQVIPQQAAFYAQLKRIGVQVYFVVYDLLPVQASQFFVPEANALFTGWLNAIAEADGLMCISRSTADDLMEWLGGSSLHRTRPLKIGWFHLGANVAESVPSVGVPEEAPELLQRLASQSTFLMVGTIEPRKGKTQTLHAFEKLWAKGINVNLVIVGKQGWMVEALIEEIRHHPENGKRLFWLSGISDEYLEKLYAASRCLISASSGEGFGLPLIEAADHKIPILARDLPVFREVAGANAYYFDGETPEALAEAVQAWIALDETGKAPQSGAIPRLTWKQSTKSLLDVLMNDTFYRHWTVDGSLRYRGNDHRLNTLVGKRAGRTMATTGKAGFLLFGPYAVLKAGTYRARLHLTLENCSCAGSYADVVIDHGQQVLGTAAVNGTVPGKELLEILFVLAVSCTDFEFRLWVTEQSDLVVSKVEIEPVRETVRAEVIINLDPSHSSTIPESNPLQPNASNDDGVSDPSVASKNVRQLKTTGRAKKGKRMRNLTGR
jgi:glycosyltransferase involved in cell wall biosynthesis